MSQENWSHWPLSIKDTSQEPAQSARLEGMQLHITMHKEAPKGFDLRPRCEVANGVWAVSTAFEDWREIIGDFRTP